MGYNTLFFGKFQLVDKPLSFVHQDYLNRFNRTRRMKRDETLVSNMVDPWRQAVGLPVGPEGAYYVASPVPFGQDYTHPSVLDENKPPQGQPSLWCHWTPDASGEAIHWDGAENFYDYDKWLEYLINHFLKPWGYSIEGTLRWIGEDPHDQGTLYVSDNEVFRLPDSTLGLIAR